MMLSTSLCFGPVWSDFLGLRLAMHIRFTETVNRYTPIFIYGVTTEWRQMYKVECADILRTKGVCVISVKQKALADSLCHITQTNEKEFHKDLAGVHMNIPSDIGDNHSVANKWAIHRWLSMIDWEGDEPKVADDGFKLTLYFKYLEARYGKHDKFSKNKSILGVYKVSKTRPLYISTMSTKKGGNLSCVSSLKRTRLSSYAITTSASLTHKRN